MLFTKNPYLEYSAGGKVKQAALNKSPFVIGTGPDCNLIIRSGQIAPKHVELVKGPVSWNLRLVGANPVFVNGVPLSDLDRNLKSGDVFELKGVLSFTFRDPASDLEKARVAKREAQDLAAAQEKPEERTLKTLLPYAIALSALLFILIAYLRGGDETDTALRAATPGNIKIAVDDIGPCLERAAARFSGATMPRDIARQGEFWQIAEATAQSQDIHQRKSRLEDNVQYAFAEALGFEERGDTNRASQAYSRIREDVPDINCLANQLAAERIKALTE
ncbi:FHA domain-containing protein [Rhizobium sp. L1K21]|uniref:FHA domain-containing protein n=1 Tax=Rhizobium sp. L1K21 TaxID=2954933 RepID=UPI0020934F3B|nr:FHA domain-containing protein [Rhizobium sp. L1K21]